MLLWFFVLCVNGYHHLVLTGSVVVMGVDRSGRVSVCVAVHGQITISGSGYPLGSGAGLIVDALESRRVV